MVYKIFKNKIYLQHQLHIRSKITCKTCLYFIAKHRLKNHMKPSSSSLGGSLNSQHLDTYILQSVACLLFRHRSLSVIKQWLKLHSEYDEDKLTTLSMQREKFFEGAEKSFMLVRIKATQFPHNLLQHNEVSHKYEASHAAERNIRKLCN